MTRSRPRTFPLLVVALAAACSRGPDEAGKQRVFSAGEAARAVEGPFDWSRPDAALVLGAEEAARRIGSFEWTAAVEWTFSRAGDPPARVHALERHRVRQSATGEFEVESDLDPGLGEGSETGKHLVYVGGMTYARSRAAPFGAFRERPTDRGRDARRFRDETFGVVADVARLYGQALVLQPAGETTMLGRPARRYRIALAKNAAAPPPASAQDGRTFPQGGPDADTRRRLAFLEGAVPLALDGELVADAETGVPLRTRLKGALGVKDDPAARAQLEISAQVKSLGSGIAAIAPPKGALPDERKPPGVSGALEASGLKQRGEKAMGREEPGEEGD
jgi:hypothetical protein